MADADRRNFLTRLGIGASAAILAGCDRISQSAGGQEFLKKGADLAYRVQRLIAGRDALAPEFSKADIAPVFRANGTLDPDTDDYNAHVAGNFRDWRIKVAGLVEHSFELSMEELRAMPARSIDKLFFLAARTPGRAVALQALERISAPSALPIRVVELVARDKACEHPDKACHGESCPLARGFYDRLPAARQAALDSAWLDQARVREVAREHAICPYYLSQELSRWADLVVCDYNYYFDMSALLYALTAVVYCASGTAQTEDEEWPQPAPYPI